MAKGDVKQQLVVSTASGTTVAATVFTATAAQDTALLAIQNAARIGSPTTLFYNGVIPFNNKLSVSFDGTNYIVLCSSMVKFQTTT